MVEQSTHSVYNKHQKGTLEEERITTKAPSPYFELGQSTKPIIVKNDLCTFWPIPKKYS